MQHRSRGAISLERSLGWPRQIWSLAHRGENSATAGIVGYLARSRDHVCVLNLAAMPEEDCDPLKQAWDYAAEPAGAPEAGPIPAGGGGGEQESSSTKLPWLQSVFESVFESLCSFGHRAQEILFEQTPGLEGHPWLGRIGDADYLVKVHVVGCIALVVASTCSRANDEPYSHEIVLKIVTCTVCSFGAGLPPTLCSLTAQ